MPSSTLSRNKWDVWTTVFWFIAFLTIPIAIYLIATLGFVQVPRFSGSYSTRMEVNPGILVSSLFLVASTFFAAAFFGVMNDIYKRLCGAAVGSEGRISEDCEQARPPGVKVKTINDGSPLEGKIKVGYRLTEVNDNAVHKPSEVSGKLEAGKNNLKFLSSDGKAVHVSLELNPPPKLGVILE